MFLNKQKKVEGMLTEYFHNVALCLDKFEDVFNRFHRDSDTTGLESGFSEIHEFESKADDIRHEVEDMMYLKALFPESRGDILGLLETVDRIPNQAETAVRMVLYQNISIPEELWPLVLKLINVSVNCASVALEASKNLFSNFTAATVAVGRVDELESEADHVRAELIRKIFSSPIEDLDKILLRDLAHSIEAISDRAENVGDRIRIAVAKRKV